MTESGTTSSAPDPPESCRGPSQKWPAILLLSYFVLLAATGYFAFLQNEFNPQTIMTDNERQYLEGDNVALRDFTMESLKAEGAAYTARRDLAVQSFNVVLGAILGFLSASSMRGQRT